MIDPRRRLRDRWVLQAFVGLFLLVGGAVAFGFVADDSVVRTALAFFVIALGLALVVVNALALGLDPSP